MYLFVGYLLIVRLFDGAFGWANILTISLIQIISFFCIYKLYQNGYFKERKIAGLLSILYAVAAYWLIAILVHW
jgi:hypothetical protein